MARRTQSQPDRRDPLAWAKVADVTEFEGFAIKAMLAGTATKDQQQGALKFIVNRLARVDDLSFVFDQDGGERATAFCEGRRSVGLALRAILALPSDKLRKQND